MPNTQWKAAQLDRFKPVLFLLCLYPLGRWFLLGWQDGLTANPPEFLTRSSGLWAWVLLLGTLAVTPLRLALGQPALMRWRRMLGLFAFFYAALHTLAWAWWDRSGSWQSMWQDILQRPFITLAAVAMVLMLALALTSTHRAQKAMGGPAWRRLHRSVYLIAVLSLLHYYLVMAGKNDVLEVFAYGLLLLGLFVPRLAAAWRRRFAQGPA